MNTVTPVPIIIHNEEDKCPKCKKEEDTILVCRHCGYEYPKEEQCGKWDGLIVFIFFVSFAYALVTLVVWLASSPESSLVDVIIRQGRFIKALRIW